MGDENRIVRPGPDHGTVCFEDGRVVRPPAGWKLLRPGDAALTRRVKKSGPSWTVEVMRRGRKTSAGVWAAAAIIARVESELEAERSTEAWARRRAADAKRRDEKQAAYVGDFRSAVTSFLDFPPRHAELARALADAVAGHATPVGSGTVARTRRIPIERRAEAAVIAWLRHQTTGYDDMKIARVKGKRREVRRDLAERSRELLDVYRRGGSPPLQCPIRRALDGERQNGA